MLQMENNTEKKLDKDIRIISQLYYKVKKIINY